MGVISINIGNPTGQVGVGPRIISILTTDTLDSITTPGYMNSLQDLSTTFLPTDINFIAYNGGIDVFSSSFGVGGVITLETLSLFSNIVPPITNGDFAVFSGTSGSLQDKGYKPSNPAKTVICSVNNATTVGALATFSDTVGTVTNSGYLPSNPAATNVCMQQNTATVGVMPVYADVNGTLINRGYVPSNPALTNVVMASQPILPGGYAGFVDATGTITTIQASEYDYFMAHLLSDQSFLTTAPATIAFNEVDFPGNFGTMLNGVFTFSLAGTYIIQLMINASSNPVVAQPGQFLLYQNDTLVSQTYSIFNYAIAGPNCAFLQGVVTAAIGDTINVTAYCNGGASNTMTIAGNIQTNIIIQTAV
jgi:hypothetical protein